MFSLFYLYIVRNDDNKDDQSIMLNIAEPSSECGCSSLNKSSYCPKTTNLRIFFKLTSRNGLEAQGHVE